MSRRHRVVGAVGVAGAVLAIGVAPAAHADWDDLFQPFADLFSGAETAGSALSTAPSFDTALGDFYQDYLVAPFQSLEQSLGFTHDPASADIAGSAAGGVAAPPSSDTIPLTVDPSHIGPDGTTFGGEPTISVNVGGGPATNVLVDTGSNGLTVPFQDFGWKDAGFPTGFNIATFTGGVGYVYMTVPTTVEFGGQADLTTGTTDVNVVLFSFPTTVDQLLAGHWTIGSMFGPANVDGVLGIGVGSGPNDTNPVEALPGDLSKGVLIDQANNTLTFGADPFSSTEGTVVQGSPFTQLLVQMTHGDVQTPVTPVSAVMDSGGVFGTMPTSVVPGVSAGSVVTPGTTVDVYAPTASGGQGALLYSYTVTGDSQGHSVDGPTYVAPPSYPPNATASMNTGNWLFAQNQVYVSTVGSTGYMHIVPNP